MFEAVTVGPYATKKYKSSATERGSTTVDSFCDVREIVKNKAIFERVVQARRNTARISIAAPGDFRCGDEDFMAKNGQVVFPYCFDFIQRRALYVADADSLAVQQAPFYYLYLRRTAERIRFVPVSHGPLSDSPIAGVPVFLFSPGRVGSTMISRVLAEAGIPSVSEPDFYTQLAHPLFRAMPSIWRAPFERAMDFLSQDLCAALGAAPVVKLRAECAAAPELFLRSPESKSIVLFRGFESWSRSTAQVFGAGPEKAVRKYMTALSCYQTLSRTGRCHLMRYEDWVNEPEEAAAALGRFLGATLPPEAVRRALSSHSQEGTPLISQKKPEWERKWQGALALWHSPRLKAFRANLEIPPVWD